MIVYFVQAGESGPVKIGVTQNIEDRVVNLQTGNPEKINVMRALTLRSKEDAFNLESKLHNKFKDVRLNGEWFKYSKYLDDFIKNISFKDGEPVFSEPYDMTDYVWAGEIGPSIEKIAQEASKVLKYGDIELYRYIAKEVRELLNDIEGGRLS